MTYNEFRVHVQAVSDNQMDTLLEKTGVEFADVKLPKSSKTNRRFRKNKYPKNQWITFKKLQRMLEKLGRV